MDRKLGIGIRRLALLALIAGCAQVHVYKVEDGKTVGPDGLRFYMPRPYVLVHEPFIVGAKVFVVSGELTPDGQHVTLKKVPSELDPELKAVLETLAPGGQLMASQIVALPDAVPAPERGGAQGREEGGGRDKTKAGEGSKPEDQPADDGTGGGKKDDKPAQTAGKSTLKVTNDNSAFAVTPLKRYVDIVWLPDFDEQYVVESSSRLGNADVSLQYGQGWSLQSLDAKTDNSDWLGPLVDLYSQATKLAGQVASAQLGFPIPGAQGRAEETKGTGMQAFTGGTPVAVKITLASIAAPGLYPVLKPSEWDAARAAGVDAETRNRILVPVPPLTNVAFNIAHAVVIEAARADSDAAMRLYQYIETGPSKPVGGGDAGQPKGAAGLQQEIAKRLQAANMTGWSVSVDDKDAKTKTYTVKAVRPTGDTQHDGAVRSIVKEVIEGSGGTIDDADITFKSP